MKDYLEYKEYVGSAEVDTEGGVLMGKLLFIPDVIAYSASNIRGLKKAFQEAVDEYLQTCADLGDTPDTPCKGSFNVRVGTDLHREVALAARTKRMTLNDFVREALALAVQTQARQVVQHVHEHHHNVMIQKGAQVQRIATAAHPAIWEAFNATQH